MNKLILVGRLTKDAEVSKINENLQVMKYSLAVERDYKDKEGKKPVDFINCEQIGKDFSKLSAFLTKGKMILVEGSLNIDKANDKYFTKAKVNRIELLGGNEKSSQNNAGGFEPVGDEDLPF